MKVIKKSEYPYCVKTNTHTIFSDGLILEGNHNTHLFNDVVYNTISFTKKQILKTEETEDEVKLIFGGLCCESLGDNFVFTESFESKMFFYKNKNIYFQTVNRDGTLKIYKEAHLVGDNLRPILRYLDSLSIKNFNIFVMNILMREDWGNLLMPIILKLKDKKKEVLNNIFHIFCAKKQYVLERLLKNGLLNTTEEILLGDLLLVRIERINIPKYAVNFCKEIEPWINKNSLCLVNDIVSVYGRDDSKLVLDFIMAAIKLFQKNQTVDERSCYHRFDIIEFITNIKDSLFSVYIYNKNIKNVLDYIIKAMFTQGLIDEGIYSIKKVISSYGYYLKMNNDMRLKYKEYPKCLYKCIDNIEPSYQIFKQKRKENCIFLRHIALKTQCYNMVKAIPNEYIH